MHCSCVPRSHKELIELSIFKSYFWFLSPTKLTVNHRDIEQIWIESSHDYLIGSTYYEIIWKRRLDRRNIIIGAVRFDSSFSRSPLSLHWQWGLIAYYILSYRLTRKGMLMMSWQVDYMFNFLSIEERLHVQWKLNITMCSIGSDSKK